MFIKHLLCAWPCAVFWEFGGKQTLSPCPQRAGSLVRKTDVNCRNRNHTSEGKIANVVKVPREACGAIRVQLRGM